MLISLALVILPLDICLKISEVCRMILKMYFLLKHYL